MKQYIRNQIRAKLKNYKVSLNTVDPNLPMSAPVRKKVAVIGGGIAGISAAANLCERNFEVTIFEKNHYLGGKLGSWTFESKGEVLRAEHGFHAFFRQYYNLRAFMKKLGIDRHLIPIEDYVILYQDGKRQGFRGIDNTPGFNILDLRKKGVFNFLTYLNPLSMSYLNLLRYHPDRTFEKFDGMSFAQFAKQTRMPPNMQLVFTSFARAFFAEPEKISMAELIKGFHFYFLSNDDGLFYDVLEDDFEHTFLQPCQDFLWSHGVDIRLDHPVQRIGYKGNQFLICGEIFDYCVLTLDAKQVKRLVENSPDLLAYQIFHEQMRQLRCTDRYAVYRIWTDKFETQKDLPFFVFTDRLKCLDSVTFYHAMEKESAEWSRKNGGGIFELHSYSLPDDLKDDDAVKKQLMEEFFHFFPELNGLQVRHEFFQHRDDFPAFHVGQHIQRPAVHTEVPNLFLAGDWVKLPVPAMLMEAAYTSGALAANGILEKEGLQEHLLESVYPYGLLSS
jgi:carotenoid phi-ring synthase / carotenoid chi-ring synthase